MATYNDPYPFIAANDTIRGTDGTLYWNIDGEQYDIFYAKNVEINLEIGQDDITCIGSRLTQKKLSTSSISGSMTVYSGSSQVKTMISNYLAGGKYPNLELVTINYDKDSEREAQVIHYYGVQITNLPLTKLDSETSALEEDIEFTCNGYKIDISFVEDISELYGMGVANDEGVSIVG